MIVRHDDSPWGSMLHGGSESATTWLVFGETARAMTDVSDILPNDVDALRALLATALADHTAAVAERDAIRAERDQLAARNERLEAIIAEIRRAHFGRKSERITDDQLALALDELETTLAKEEAEADKTDKREKKARSGKRRGSRFPNLDHLPNVGVGTAGKQGLTRLRGRLPDRAFFSRSSVLSARASSLARVVSSSASASAS